MEYRRPAINLARTGEGMKDGRQPEIQTEEAVQTSNVADLATLCKALGHPVRMEIIRQLRALDRCVCSDLVERLPVAQSTVSQHLKVLKQAGLIKGEVAGPCTCYRLDHQAIEAFKTLIEAL
jgi:ArsR family transcriptional regulator